MKQSELWQRIRAARKFAGVTQEAVANLFGLSRPSVALWESSREKRTHPSIKQVNLFAAATGLPVDFFLNDAYSTSDVFKLGNAEQTIRTLSAQEVMRIANARLPAAEVLQLTDQTTGAKNVTGFWSAVEFMYDMASSIKQDSGFNRTTKAAGIEWRLAFHQGKTLAHMTTGAVAEGLGYLLAAERCLRGRVDKHLPNW